MKRRTAIRNVVIISAGASLLPSCMQESSSSIPLKHISITGSQEQMLAQLTAATGGRLYKPQSFAGLEATYAEVAEELRHQYALYYTPLNKVRDGGFRRWRVEMTNPTYQSHTRVGYFAPKL